MNDTGVFDTVEDMTESFLNGNRDKLAELIQDYEDKSIVDISTNDFLRMFDIVKKMHSAVRTMENQQKALVSQVNMLYRSNQELSALAKAISESAVGMEEESARICQVVGEYTTDFRVDFVDLELNDKEVPVSKIQLRQIISWYKKGYVFFSKGQSYHINNMEGEHDYTFGEVVTLKENGDNTRTCDVVVTGETPWIVDVLKFDDFAESNQYVTPTHVTKDRVLSKEVKKYMIGKEALMEFMANIHYVNFFHDETNM